MIEERALSIELVRPISNDKESHTVLMVNPPLIGWRRQAEGHLRHGQHPEAVSKFQIALVARCSNVPGELVEMMEGDQFGEAWEFINGFLGYGRPTGTI